MKIKNRGSACVFAACAMAALSAGAYAGPDVIVSTVGSTLTKNGTVGTITAYSMTTVSCNIGDAEAIWLANVNSHPVIGQQMYRIANGRCEQIGMSWLKHGFCAADAPSCTGLVPGSTYISNPSCDWLGKFATDTYSASLNGSQGNLGPRSEVNASTGAYPYPYVLGAGILGNAINKRLQIENADLNPTLNPGARYFAEVHYVPTDEAATQRYNNASYREVLVGSLSSGGYTLSFSGATVPMKTAIEAWKAIDSSVQLSTIDLDGRIIVGSKATDLGGGNWQYEYAVYNHNSHDSVNEFTVPKTSGVAALNLGFHDVSYHSGEPYSGTDWTGTVSETGVRWNTDEFSANPNANAIRWSTTYNFRFQSSQAPVLGSVTLGLFRSNGTASVTNVLVPGIPPASGSCCITDGSCSITLQAGCSGSWTTGGSCSPNVCPQPSGACCSGTSCSIATAAACGGSWQGAGSACGPTGNPTTCCKANFNAVNGVELQDIFDFLNAWFANLPSADINGGGVALQDIFDFLNAWFAGC